MSKRKTFSLKPKALVVGMMVAGLVSSGAVFALALPGEPTVTLTTPISTTVQEPTEPSVGADPVSTSLSLLGVPVVAGPTAPAAVVKAGAPGAGSTIANGSVMLIWTSDGVSSPIPAQLGLDKDFMAVVDGEPYSSTYGKVIWTAELESVIAGGVPAGVLDTSAHNEAHHMLSYTSYIDPVSKKKYNFAGGVISKNVFRFDITSVRSIPSEAALVICGTQPMQSSLTDDFVVMPNGNIMLTYMSSVTYAGNEFGEGTPEGGGAMAEFNPMRNAKHLVDALGVKTCMPGDPSGSAEAAPPSSGDYLGEYQVAPDTGVSSYVSRRAPLHKDTQVHRAAGANKGSFFFGNTNAAREGLPHGMALTYDGKYLVASDYAVAVSIGAAAANVTLIDPANLVQAGDDLTFSSFGASVRVLKVNPATLGDPKVYNENAAGQHALAGKPNGPVADYMQSISVVPDGPRRERIAFHEEPEGLMPFVMPHQAHHCPDQAGWAPGADGKFGTLDDPMGDNICPGAEIPHNGASVNSMCGGTMFYTANIELPQSANNGNGPIWHAVYDVGPCAGVSYQNMMDDDRFLIQPIAGIESNSKPDPLRPNDFDRDYPREHSRRMLTMDFRPLLAKGNGIQPDGSFVDPIKCHFPGEATRIRANGVVEVNGATGRSLYSPGDSFGASVPTDSLNILVHNNRASDCPRVVGVVGQFETGPHASEMTGLPAGVLPGLATTQTSDGADFPGVGYTQAAVMPPLMHSDTDVGGAPTLTNINTAQNMNTRGGPHFTLTDRVGFCMPTGSSNGVATCKTGSYYDLAPAAGTNAPKPVYPATAKAAKACADGTSAFKGAGSSTLALDPSCVARAMFIQYFVELNHAPAPGTGSDGDRTVCSMLVNRVTGASMMDPLFVDELTKQPCLDFDGAHRERTSFSDLGQDTCGTVGGAPSVAGDYCWPGARGGKGGAKPHGGSFERDGANLIGPGYAPPVSANPDGNI